VGKECHLAIDGFMVLLIFNRGVLHKFIRSSEHAQKKGVGSSANKPKIYYFKILEKKKGKKKKFDDTCYARGEHAFCSTPI
jgi:hypothetical protein